MGKRIGLLQYLKSINHIELQEPHSQVTVDFVEFVVGAHSWYKDSAVLDSKVNMIAFNFFISPEHLTETRNCEDVVYDQFQNLSYGVRNTPFHDRARLIPREIADAGLVVVPGDYKTDQSKRILRTGIVNMLKAIDEYKGRYKVLSEEPVLES